MLFSPRAHYLVSFVRGLLRLGRTGITWIARVTGIVRRARVAGIARITGICSRTWIARVARISRGARIGGECLPQVDRISRQSF